MSESDLDAIVVGGGHNGLTASFYLARAGMKTLVLERRDLLGGACVTEEMAPGCRASTASYIASMLRPEVIRDLDLVRHGLRMVPCEPGLQAAFEDGRVLPWWTEHERTVAEWALVNAADARTFDRIDRRLKELARYLQPFFLEAPPDVPARGWARIKEGRRVYGRVKKIRGDEITDLVEFLTGSLGDFLDRHFESETIKRMFLADNVYGMHAPPYRPGTAIGLLFHLLTGGDDDVQGWFGHVIGGMGSITQAMAAAAREAGAELRVGAPVERILATDGRAHGVVLEDGTELSSGVVVSNADPKRTFLTLMEPADADLNRRSFATLVPTLEAAERMYDIAKWGDVPDELWVDCVVASNVDPTLAPTGKHIMTCFVQYLPYRLRAGSWDDHRELLGKRVIDIVGRYAPNVPGSIEAIQVLTPLDLERTFGLTEGNIFHGDLNIQQLFFMRPVPGWSAYRTPIEGLYLCGAGVHPGGGVTGAPGYNAAHQVLRDTKGARR